MSKIRKARKLILHPILFFKDRRRKILENHSLSINPNPKSTLENILNGFSMSNVDLKHYEVALYFFGGLGNVYQIEQWIAPLKALNKNKKLIIIVRTLAVYKWLKQNTDFTMVYCQSIENLTSFYEANNIKCVLYVNHGFKNFQSLINGNALHVHINHGESDKISTITNQSKAYDYIFIVANAAYDKYNLNLMKKDMNKFIPIGRPQLEHIEKIPPFDMGFSSINNEIENDDEIRTKRKVILYAPTWEGTYESMNFTSLNDYGMSIVQEIINHPDFYLVYKPHPNTGSRDAQCNIINAEIIEYIDNHQYGECVLSGNINSLYEHIDLAVFDNSAVAIDYLRFDKPMIMSDMFHRIRGDYSKPTIVGGARMITRTDAESISMIIEEELTSDTKKIERNKMMKYFLGDFDYLNNESTDAFIFKINEVIEERDSLVKNLADLTPIFNK